MKLKMMMLTFATMVAAVAFGTDEGPTVTEATAKQRYPWNGLVDITCKVTGIDGTTY